MLILCSHLFALAQNKVATEEDIKKTASKNFEEQNYASALPLYSQLLSLNPKEVLYHYRFGVCNLYAGKDKTKPISFLEFAAKNSSTDKEVFYHLGRAYHLNYKFNEALSNYTKFKQSASSKQLEKFDVNLQIQMCKNGLELLKNIKGLSVMEKKDLREADYFRAYDLAKINAKIIVKPDEFKSSLDKKKNETSVIVSRFDAKELFFSSYGDNPNNGKDIFRVIKNPEGKWSKPINVGSLINTPFDEDYPYLHPDGHTFYFCSKGHNSMGGYDVFRCEYDTATNTFTTPENVDFPINSTDDDILYITDKENETAYFSSKRISGTGEITIYKVKVERAPMALALVKGSFYTEDKTKRPKAKLTVTNIDNGKQITILNLKEGEGKFTLYLPTGTNYSYKLESLGYVTQTETVNFPEQTEMTALEQELFLKKEGGSDKLTVINQFKKATEEDKKILTSADVLLQQANIDVNYNPNATKTLVIAKKDTTPSKKEEIIQLAEKTVKNLEQSQVELQKQVNATIIEANNRNKEAEKTKITIQETEKQITNLPESEKVKELNKLKELQAKQLEQAREALVAYNIAKELEKSLTTTSDNLNKESKYLNQIKIAQSKNDNPTFDKAVAQHINLNENQTNETDFIIKNLKNEEEKNNSEIKKIDTKEAKLNLEIKDLKLEIADIQKQIDNNKDKSVKTNLSKQIFELNEEIRLKENKINQNNIELAELTEKNKIIIDQKQIIENNKTKNNIAPINKTEIESLAQKMEEYKEQNILEKHIIITKTTETATQLSASIEPTTTTSITPSTLATTNTNIENNNSSITNTAFLAPQNEELKNEIAKIENINTNYNNKIELLEKNTDAKQKEEEKEKLLNEWNKELNNSITEINKITQNNQLTAEDNKIINEIKEKTIQKINSNNTTSSTQLLAKNNASQVSTITLTGTPKNKVEQAEAIFTNLNSKYQTQLNTTNSLPNKELQQTEKNKIIEYWNNELITLTTQLNEIQNNNNANNDDKKNIQNLITQIKTQTAINNNSLNLLANKESTNELEKNSTTAITSFTPNDAEIKEEFNPIYSNSEAKAELKQAEVLLKEQKNFLTEAESLDKKAQKITNTNEKKNLAIRSKQMTEQAKEKGVEVLQTKSIANEIQYQNNNAIIINYTESSKQTNESKSQAIALNNEAKNYNEAAFKLIVDAESTSDLNKKDELYKKAANYEKVALNKQQSAIQVLKDADTKFKAKTTPISAAATKEERANKIETIKNNKKQLAINTQLKAKADSLAALEKTNNTITKDTTTQLTITNNKLPFDSASIKNISEKKDYNNYVVLKNEAKIIENKSLNQQKLAEEYRNSSKEFYIKANNLDSLADSFTDENQKIEILQKAKEAKTNQNKFTAMADSVSQLAQNSSNEAIAKNIEAETFLQQLDKDLYEKAVTAYNKQNETNNITTDTTNSTNTINTTPEKPIEITQVVNENNELKTEKVFVQAKTPVYSSSKPIPINPQLPSGIIFKVQIGAFRNPIPADLFQGFNPVMGETIPNGITRYTAGLFKSFFSANQARIEINRLGYRDAFVVAFCNGKRIPVEQAQQLIKQGVSCDGGQLTNNLTANTTNNFTINSNNTIVTTNTITNNTTSIITNTATTNNRTNIAQAAEINKIQGLLYTVQVGVYARPVTSDKLFNIIPLYVSVAENGYLRYSSGIYNNTDAANQARSFIVANGIKDAFVVAYYNGKRISVAEAKLLESQQGSSIFTSPATSNIQPTRGINQSTITNLNTVVSSTVNTKNTATESVKPQIVYKVQIGAFKEEVPLDKAKIFFNLSLKGPIANYINEEKITIFTFGNFSDYESANASKNDMINEGLTDAFVVAYNNGIKITIEEAKQLNNK